VKKRLRKGSFTVEASFIIPLLLLVIAGLICLCLYLHDRSVLASCAAELAGKGANQKYKSEAEIKDWLTGEAQGLVAGRLLALKKYVVSVEVTKGAVVVTYTGNTDLLGGLEVCEREEAKRLNPVTFIRGTQQLKQLLER
jgi:Flp pilus assembly protein TadG